MGLRSQGQDAPADGLVRLENGLENDSKTGRISFSPLGSLAVAGSRTAVEHSARP
jgi:hypothetical protein